MAMGGNGDDPRYRGKPDINNRYADEGYRIPCSKYQRITSAESTALKSRSAVNNGEFITSDDARIIASGILKPNSLRTSIAFVFMLSDKFVDEHCSRNKLISIS